MVFIALSTELNIFPIRPIYFYDLIYVKCHLFMTSVSILTINLHTEWNLGYVNIICCWNRVLSSMCAFKLNYMLLLKIILAWKYILLCTKT